VKKQIMKYTAEQVQVAINEWQVSGLSKKAFCVQRDISPQTFYNWLKRRNETGSSGFSEVALPVRDEVNRCEVIFPSGTRVLIQGEPSASWLREVVR
jgi:transposase-like protein